MAEIDDLRALLEIDSEDKESIDLLNIYLRLARQKVLNRLYPFGSDSEFIPRKYSGKVLEVAQYLYQRRGSEGETSHSENGVNRSYENADIPASMLAEITPFVGGMKKNENA